MRHTNRKVWLQVNIQEKNFKLNKKNEWKQKLGGKKNGRKKRKKN